MAKIYKEDSPIGVKINKVEQLLTELNLEIVVGLNQEITFKDYENKIICRVADGPDYRSGLSAIPRNFDDQKLYFMEW